MQRSTHTKTDNYLLDTLSPEALMRLQPHLEPVDILLAEPIDSTEYVCFPVFGMISIVAMMQDGDSIEIWMIGREGLHSISAILGDDSPFQNAMVQLPGRALRLRTLMLRQEMQADDALRRLLLRYIQATMRAVAQSAACNRLHLLEQRCARWLLACQDRAQADRFPMTHEFLAMMLGVRRPGGSLAAGSLQQNGLITYSHGTMVIVDRQGLEATSCECYAVVRDAFARVLTH